MELKQLEAFVKVVELQSFSEAAKSIFLTQPTISSHIVSLEKELNTKLFFRTTKCVSITSSGERLYDYAKEILKLADEIYQDFGKRNQSEERIEIAGSTIPSQYILPELISVFKQKNNSIYFSLNQGDSQFVIEEILKNRVDIGFVGMKDNNSGLHYIPFYKDKLVIITPNEKKYQSRIYQECSLDKFMEEPIILREEGSGTKKSAEEFFKAKHIPIESLNVVAQMNDPEIIKRSVSKGLGISILSKKAALDYAETGKILIYEPEEVEITRNLYIVFEKRKKLTHTEKSFLEFCTQFYQVQEDWSKYEVGVTG